MRTTISIQDCVFYEAEQLAKRRGMTRSEFYSNAIKRYVQRQHLLGVRERLDAIYGAEMTGLEWPVRRAQARMLAEEKW